MKNSSKLFKRLAATAALSMALFGGASAETNYTVTFVNGQMVVQSAPGCQGQYQVFSAPLNQVRVETRYQTVSAQPPLQEPVPQTTGSSYAQAVLDYTNQERTQRGLAPLQMNTSLNAAAQGHSQEMLDLGYFSHTSPTAGRRTPSDRLRAVGVSPSFLAENIFQCSGYSADQVARLAVENWMQSPGHRRNMLDPRATHLGIGLVNQNGETSVTQVFAAGV